MPIQVLSTNAVLGALTALAPQFERTTGHRLAIRYAATNQVMSDLREGATGHVVIVTAAAIDELIKQGKVIAASRVDVGSTGVGIAVKRGAPKPDVSSPEALKRTLLQARSVAWTSRGASGLHFSNVIERLGITEQMKERGRVLARGLVGEALVRGEAEIGVQMVSELLAVPGAELVGPLPAQLQNVMRFCAGIMTRASDTAAAEAFVRFLTTPAARPVFLSTGVEPPQ